MADNGASGDGASSGTDSGAPPGLLNGLQVLDFSQFAFGPVATRLLADLGADVIKVEPLEGDFSRLTAEPFVDSITFICTNLNKRSFSVNLKDERGLDAVKRLCEQADVLVENFRPGTMDRMGLGYEELSKINPGLVYGLVLDVRRERPALAPSRRRHVGAGVRRLRDEPDGPGRRSVAVGERT